MIEGKVHDICGIYFPGVGLHQVDGARCSGNEWLPVQPWGSMQVMSTAMRAIGLLAMMQALGGCYSTDPYSFHYVDLADQSKVFLKSEPSGPTGLVIFRREPSHTPLTVSFYIDGAKIVQLARGEQYGRKVSVGQHLFGTICEYLVGTTSQNEMILAIEPGKTYALRMFSGANDVCQISPMMP